MDALILHTSMKRLRNISLKVSAVHFWAQNNLEEVRDISNET